MARPKGSKNKTTRTARTQHQIRLTQEERAAMSAVATAHGQSWGEWARQVLRSAAGLPTLEAYKTRQIQEKT